MVQAILDSSSANFQAQYWIGVPPQFISIEAQASAYVLMRQPLLLARPWRLAVSIMSFIWDRQSKAQAPQWARSRGCETLH
jgi:hypothetical protein